MLFHSHHSNNRFKVSSTTVYVFSKSLRCVEKNPLPFKSFGKELTSIQKNPKPNTKPKKLTKLNKNPRNKQKPHF